MGVLVDVGGGYGISFRGTGRRCLSCGVPVGANHLYGCSEVLREVLRALHSGVGVVVDSTTPEVAVIPAPRWSLSLEVGSRAFVHSELV